MESYKLIKANGDELEFNVGEFFLVDLKNFGNPDIEYTTQKTFYTDGETVTNFVVKPRILNFSFLGTRESMTNRTEFWNLRREILSFLSPVSGAMTFQITLDDHTIYELTNVFPTNGLSMEGNTFNNERNDGRIDEPLRLTAYDPIWRVSPINSTGSLVPTIGNQLIFPMEFPISFGVAGATFDTTITYGGTWRSYPRITIDGPFNTASLVNKATGAEIQLIQPCFSGDQRIIDLTNPLNGFTVTDITGSNKIGDINLETNFTQFYFIPDATNGIEAVMNGGNLVTTRLTVEWYTKFLGI